MSAVVLEPGEGEVGLVDARSLQRPAAAIGGNSAKSPQGAAVLWTAFGAPPVVARTAFDLKAGALCGYDPPAIAVRIVQR